MASTKQLRNEIMSKYVDENGKFIITDDLPEESKAMFKFFNDNNINYSGLKSEEQTVEDLDDEKPVESVDFDDIDYDEFIGTEDIDLDEDEDDSQSVDDMFADL